MFTKNIESEKGAALIETLVTMFIVSIMGLAVAQSSKMFLSMRNKALNDQIAAQLATEKLEEFAAIDPSTLSDGETFNETVSRYERSFTRVSTVIVNSDNSRTIQVNITKDNQTFGGDILMSNTYSPWKLS